MCCLIIVVTHSITLPAKPTSLPILPWWHAYWFSCSARVWPSGEELPKINQRVWPDSSVKSEPGTPMTQNPPGSSNFRVGFCFLTKPEPFKGEKQGFGISLELPVC